ncbi:Gfo/Idh/MocA family protein [Cohnella faecalis]|uniref:Gfo/Idh/MocA family oxidoreductase n=1 Tax=Cohnella faecalis TaxID=2315694 RepID=A0A398CHG7_9BACL|nr:Gfo/Idh/MocA family oxidoreductase [Cohnella faecalis]RIE00358.1 gfo/Idh/MocA family oxidoreductase [Cohnella faecalis]
MTELKIGMVGLDTSHCSTFAALLNDPSHPNHVPGGRLLYGFPGGSPDFELSRSRMEGITKSLREERGVEMLDSIEEVARRSDAILLTSVDGRVHKEQFAKLAPYGKPIFIDKPFATSSADAKEIVELAERSGSRFFTCSMLRFGGPLLEALGDDRHGSVVGADCSGPLELEPTQPGFFWYGIHAAEMLYAALGEGCRTVRATRTEGHESVVGVWEDGRIGTIRGIREGNPDFYAVLHRERGSVGVNALGDSYNAGNERLLKHLLTMAGGAPAPVRPSLSLEIVRFIEAANESRESGEVVRL